MKVQLHEVTGKNRYCGPAAMATILGISTDHAARMLRDQSGKRAVKGVHTRHLVQALRQAGCVASECRYPSNGKITVAAWLRDHGSKFPGKHVILEHGHHFGTILGRRYLCSLTDREQVTWADIPMRRARVAAFILIEKLPESAPVDVEKARQTTDQATMNRARYLAKKHGIDIESECPGSWYVTCPTLDHDDPHEGDHYCTSPGEILTAVEDYVDCLTNGYLEAVTDPCTA